MNTVLDAFIKRYQTRTEIKLEQFTSNLGDDNTTLNKAMRYSLLDGGKRIRPLLVYAAAEALASPNDATDAFASALECVHVYSLIHDDLPAMDDDDLRRGKPTSHIAFDEATAILAGDALQCLAFELLADAPCDAQIRIEAIKSLTFAAGAKGMVLGQAFDLQAVDSTLTLDQLEYMHSLKTGALIEASVVLGALSVGADNDKIAGLRRYANAIGLAFQVQDDIIDVVSDTETLGKTQGADEALNKPTYVALLGLEKAKEKAKKLRDDAIEALADFDEKAEPLRLLAHYIVDRRH